MNNILCSISTRNRYDTTLPMAISSIANQTLKPDKLVIFDDNDNPVDLRDNPIYKFLFSMLEHKGIPWEVVFGERKGQHHNHQKANKMGYNWVWRVDDDVIAEPDVLEKLYAQTGPDVGAVGGSILTPPHIHTHVQNKGTIFELDQINAQWTYLTEIKEVEHLHCSFLYKAGVLDYNLGLSKVAHREETLFTYGLHCMGLKVLLTPCVCWHFRAGAGGIRSEDLYIKSNFDHDDVIFDHFVRTKMENKTVVVLNNGMGDHLVFKKVLEDIKNPIVFTCYPDIIPGGSIAEAQRLLGSLDPWDIYKKMAEWNWNDSLENAFRKLYKVEKT